MTVTGAAKSTRVSTPIDTAARVALDAPPVRIVSANWWVLRPFNAMARGVRMFVNETIDASRGRYER